MKLGDLSQGLVASMPRRVEAVIRQGGTYKVLMERTMQQLSFDSSMVTAQY